MGLDQASLDWETTCCNPFIAIPSGFKPTSSESHCHGQVKTSAHEMQEQIVRIVKAVLLAPRCILVGWGALGTCDHELRLQGLDSPWPWEDPQFQTLTITTAGGAAAGSSCGK